MLLPSLLRLVGLFFVIIVHATIVIKKFLKWYTTVRPEENHTPIVSQAVDRSSRCGYNGNMKTLLLFAHGFVLYNTVVGLVNLAAGPALRPALNLVALALIKSQKRKDTKMKTGFIKYGRKR